VAAAAGVVASRAVDLPALGPLLPLVEQVGFGALAGFVAGFAVKKIGKLAALLLGTLFVVVQGLAWVGYVQVNWSAVQADAAPWLEEASLRQGWGALLDVLTYNLPFAAAFVPGLLLGLRRG